MCVCVYTKIQLDICKYTYIFMAIFHGYLAGFGITLENHRVCMPVKLLLKRFNRRGGSAILWAGPRKDTETEKVCLLSALVFPLPQTPIATLSL